MAQAGNTPIDSYYSRVAVDISTTFTLAFICLPSAPFDIRKGCELGKKYSGKYYELIYNIRELQKYTRKFVQCSNTTRYNISRTKITRANSRY